MEYQKTVHEAHSIFRNIRTHALSLHIQGHAEAGMSILKISNQAERELFELFDQWRPLLKGEDSSQENIHTISETLKDFAQRYGNQFLKVRSRWYRYLRLS